MAHVPADGGVPLWVPEALPGPFAEGEGPLLSRYTLLASAETTGGALTGVSIAVPPGNGPPPHLHAGSDESFFVLEGTFEVRAGDREFVIAAGDYAFIPRGTMHSWRNTTGRAGRMLLLYTPSDMEQFFRDIGRPVRPGEKDERLTHSDVRRAEAVSRRHFGPLPGPGDTAT
ncbi:cupin domain-containing protein [Plantactinospora sp. B5E13]|uniref:cupin domain-containing protein n=1 Tax=unclassified Plantactinospora TaxID=2631981 RepID=UPI00325C5250